MRKLIGLELLSTLRSDFYSDFDLLKLVKFPITC